MATTELKNRTLQLTQRQLQEAATGIVILDHGAFSTNQTPHDASHEERPPSETVKTPSVPKNCCHRSAVKILGSLCSTRAVLQQLFRFPDADKNSLETVKNICDLTSEAAHKTHLLEDELRLCKGIGLFFSQSQILLSSLASIQDPLMLPPHDPLGLSEELPSLFSVPSIFNSVSLSLAPGPLGRIKNALEFRSLARERATELSRMW